MRSYVLILTGLLVAALPLVLPPLHRWYWSPNRRATQRRLAASGW